MRPAGRGGGGWHSSSLVPATTNGAKINTHIVYLPAVSETAVTFPSADARRNDASTPLKKNEEDMRWKAQLNDELYKKCHE